MDRERRQPNRSPDDHSDRGERYYDEEYPSAPAGREYAGYEQEPDIPDVPRRRRRTTELPPDELATRRPSTRNLRPAQRASSQPRRPQRRRRGRWSQVLLGCGLGIGITLLVAAVAVVLVLRTIPGTSSLLPPILGGLQAFSKVESLPFPLQTIGQLQICNKVGNVTVTVDPNPNAKAIMVTAKKMVRVHNQEEADLAFQRMTVEVQRPTEVLSPLVCVRPQPTATPGGSTPSGADGLVINVTLPPSNGAIDQSHTAVDLTVTVPASKLPKDSPSVLLNLEAPTGDIQVDGISGTLVIYGNNGNVSVTNAAIADGSVIQTGQGKVTFNGFLAAPTNAQAAARYVIKCEQGSIDVTLPPITNITLDANTNVGTIKSEFDIQIKTKDQESSFHGPLNPAAGTPPTATLLLDVSTGDISLHKAQL